MNNKHMHANGNLVFGTTDLKIVQHSDAPKVSGLKIMETMEPWPQNLKQGSCTLVKSWIYHFISEKPC